MKRIWIYVIMVCGILNNKWPYFLIILESLQINYSKNKEIILVNISIF